MISGAYRAVKAPRSLADPFKNALCVQGIKDSVCQNELLIFNEVILARSTVQ